MVLKNTEVLRKIKGFSSIEDFKEVSLNIFRSDGHFFLNYNKKPDNTDELGALSVGLYQASAETAKLISKTELDKPIIQFSDSKTGFLITNVILNGDDYIISLIIKDFNQIAKTKHKLKMLSFYLEEHFSNIKTSELENSDFLFTDISDDEVDKLFSF